MAKWAVAFVSLCFSEAQPEADIRYDCIQDDKYQLQDRAYLQDIQYAPIYFSRLMQMQPRLLERVRKAWPGIQREPCGILVMAHLCGEQGCLSLKLAMLSHTESKLAECLGLPALI